MPSSDLIYNKKIIQERLTKDSVYLKNIVENRRDFIDKTSTRVRESQIANEFDNGLGNFLPLLLGKTQFYKDISYNAYNKQFEKSTGVDLYQVEDTPSDLKKQHENGEKKLYNKIFYTNLAISLFFFTLIGSIIGGVQFGLIGAAIGFGAGLVGGGFFGSLAGFVDANIEKTQNKNLLINEVEQQAKSDGQDIANTIQIDKGAEDTQKNTQDIEEIRDITQKTIKDIEELKQLNTISKAF